MDVEIKDKMVKAKFQIPKSKRLAKPSHANFCWTELKKGHCADIGGKLRSWFPIPTSTAKRFRYEYDSILVVTEFCCCSWEFHLNLFIFFRSPNFHSDTQNAYACLFLPSARLFHFSVLTSDRTWLWCARFLFLLTHTLRNRLLFRVSHNINMLCVLHFLCSSPSFETHNS